MRVLLVGSGAREHALAWKLVGSHRLRHLICIPGNPGMAELGEIIDTVAPTDIAGIAAVASSQKVDLVVIGPEAPLAAGLVDALTEGGIAAFGPSRAAARLESSKAFAKELMGRAGVTTASAAVFHDPGPAADYLRSRSGPYVVKADGLAGGKGVVVTDDRSEALAWVDHCLAGGLGDAGRTVLLEDYLVGPELSVFAACDGKDAVLLAPARDYKRLFDDDRGPNTGGMGCYSPVDLPQWLMAEALEAVVRPVLGTLAEEGTPYVGFLYVGLVLTDEGPKVLEFNVRLGDPEAQVVLPRLGADLLDLILACLEGSIGGVELVWSSGAAVGVVLASEGYPGPPTTGARITGVQEAVAVPGCTVFQAGTARRGARLETAGGRVLTVVGMGETVAEARSATYRAASHISWPGMQFRTDIARGD
ncbi:MAG TPA: phosphoribosylamine--glycine ligase [Acidimicrobiia bacterium]